LRPEPDAKLFSGTAVNMGYSRSIEELSNDVDSTSGVRPSCFSAEAELSSEFDVASSVDGRELRIGARSIGLEVDMVSCTVSVFHAVLPSRLGDEDTDVELELVASWLIDAAAGASG